MPPKRAATPALASTDLLIQGEANAPSGQDWEYYYITFEQSSDGVWRVKHLNGVWQPNWEQGLTFNEAVDRLSRAGWKLARFANGIHIFKRSVAQQISKGGGR
ncbi:MAG: hypothetical protein HC915_03950 [Anaerolineae bacterium]|nr:hypothetical protein [Anaerolineae bacterium]